MEEENYTLKDIEKELIYIENGQYALERAWAKRNMPWKKIIEHAENLFGYLNLCNEKWEKIFSQDKSQDKDMKVREHIEELQVMLIWGINPSTDLGKLPSKRYNLDFLIENT